MASGIQVSGSDALKLRPESGAVQEKVNPDPGHCAGFDQFSLDRLGVVVQQFVRVENRLPKFEKPCFQRDKIGRLGVGHSYSPKSSVLLGGLGRFEEYGFALFAIIACASSG